MNKKNPANPGGLTGFQRELQDSNSRPLTLEASALPTVLNSHATIFCASDGHILPVRNTVCQLLGFAVHLVDAAARTVFVKLQAIWMLALVFGGRVGPLFAFGAGQGHDDPCFICHIRIL